MKSIVKYTSGLIFNTIAAPVVVTGQTLQAVAKGTLYVGNATLEIGQRTELKGHKLADGGAHRVAEAKVEMQQSKEQRKIDKAASKAQAVRDRAAARTQRIQDLEIACAMRKQIAELDMGALTRMARELQGNAFETVPAQG